MDSPLYKYKLFTFPAKTVKLRVCPVCNKNPLLSPFSTKCRSCVHSVIRIDRTDVLKTLETGEFTLEQAGKKYGLTRERIRQIWKKNTGMNYDRYRQRSKGLKTEKREQFLNSVNYICLACKKEVTHRQKNGWIYCSKCRKGMDRGSTKNYNITKVCKNCGKKFHPWANITAPSQRGKGLFCSFKCYWESPDFVAHRSFSRFTKEKLLSLVSTFVEKNGRLPKYKEINKKGLGFGSSTIYRYFNGLPDLWNQVKSSNRYES